MGAGFDREDSWAQIASPVTAASGTYVNFRHAFDFDADYAFDQNGVIIGGPYRYDGGRVEYSVNGGGSWVDAGSLFTHGRYNGRISNTTNVWPGYTDPNPLKGKLGFVAS